MTGTPLLLRTTVVAALAVCGVLTVVSVLLMPDFGGTMVERLEAVAEAGTAASVSAFGFTLSQLPFAVGVLGVAHLLWGRTPVLAALAGLLMLLGAFGQSGGSGKDWLNTRRSRWIIGSPDEARARVASFAEAGIERIMLQDFLPRDLEMIDLIAAELIDRV